MSNDRTARPSGAPSARHDHGTDELSIALVMGASRGLGLLIARELGQRGHRVVICARDESELLRGAAILKDAGVDVAVRVCDVADADAVTAVVESVEDEVGPIHTAVTVAGVISVGPLESMRRVDFEEAVGTILWGPVNVALAVLPHMRRRASGHIATVTSIGGVVAVPHLLPYSTAKFGAVGFSQGLSAELAGTGITATTLIPGLLRTGAHLHAQFVGEQKQEYAWFTVSDSIPVLSMDAERAARLMVEATLAGKPTLILTPAAKLGARIHGLAPATTVRMAGLAQRLLPSAPAGRAEGASSGKAPGAAVDAQTDSRLFGLLTRLSQRAAQRFNETRSQR